MHCGPFRRARKLSFLIALGSISAGMAVRAQEPTAAPDGGTRETMQSVTVYPVPNAAFRATVATEWTHVLPDGSKSTIYNRRLVARDNAGRVFQERRFLTPNGNREPTPISELQYDDPLAGNRYLCRPALHMCRESRLRLPTAVPATRPPGPLPNGAGTLTREDLGHRFFQDLDATGTREITTLAKGVFGNEKAQPVIKEIWYAPRLKLNLLTERFDPRVSSVQNIQVTAISLAEPDARLFALPEGYRVVADDGVEDGR